MNSLPSPEHFVFNDLTWTHALCKPKHIHFVQCTLVYICVDWFIVYHHLICLLFLYWVPTGSLVIWRRNLPLLGISVFRRSAAETHFITKCFLAYRNALLSSHTHTHTHARAHTRSHTHTHTTNTHANACMRTHTGTHTHTHTHTHVLVYTEPYITLCKVY